MGYAAKTSHTFLLRLPASVREHAVELAHKDGTSLNHFISLAVAEKIARLESGLAALNQRPEALVKRPLPINPAGLRKTS